MSAGGGGDHVTVTFLSSTDDLARLVAKSAMEWMWGMELVITWIMGWVSLASMVMERLDVFRLWMAVLTELIMSEMLKISLDCSVVVALINSHSLSRLLLVFALSAVSLMEMAVAISVEMFPVSL